MNIKNPNGMLLEQSIILSAYRALDLTNQYSVKDLYTRYKDVASKRFNAHQYGLMLQQNLAMFLSQYHPEYREEDRDAVIEPDIVHIHDITKSFEVKCTVGQYIKSTNSWTFRHSFKMPAPNKPVVENYVLLKVYDPFRYPEHSLRGTFKEIAIAKLPHSYFQSSGSRGEAYLSSTERASTTKVLCHNNFTRSSKSEGAPLTLDEALDHHLTMQHNWFLYES